MRLIAIIFCSSIIFNGCAGKKSIRDIDYEAELEKGKLALSKKKYVRAQDHFNTVVIGASHTELGDDALFYRQYANAYARHLVAGDRRIEKIFEQWRSSKALDSPLEKNEVLVKTLLAETPWVRDATSETEARSRVANLFDTNRVQSEISLAIERLNGLRNPDGGWPWFPGGRSSDTITLSISINRKS